MKKIIKLLALVIIIILTITIIMFSLINKNNKYLNSITKDIKSNYKLKSDITYSNKYGNYYIFTTSTKVIVLNKEFEEILSKDNKLMYEETILKNNKLTYKYYDATNNELIKETKMEQK